MYAKTFCLKCKICFQNRPRPCLEERNWARKTSLRCSIGGCGEEASGLGRTGLKIPGFECMGLRCLVSGVETFDRD